MGKIEYSNLDTLRSVAILTVLVDHLVPTLHAQFQFGSPLLLSFTGHIGQAGVLAFFVHTSIVLMMSLERMKQESSSVTWRFYIRRAFRIYPLAWVTMALALTLGLPSNTWREPDPVSTQVILSNVLLIQNIWTKKQIIQPLWSLAYEMQMYLVLPLLFGLVSLRRGLTWVAILMAITSIGGYVLGLFTGGRLNMAAYLPCFIAGVWCYGAMKKFQPKVSSHFWLPIVLLIVFAYTWTHQAEPEPVFWQGWIFCAGLAALIPLVKNTDVLAIKTISHQIAKYSYGMYLLHVPVLYFVFRYLKVSNVALGAMLFFVVTTAVSVVAYHLIEEPLINWGRKVTTPKHQVT